MSDRRPLIAGNWKLHKTGSEAVDYCNSFKSLVSGTTDVDILLAPVFTSIYPAVEAVSGSTIEIGAQDLYWESTGAYTGEISAEMIKSCGCTYVIIGHSERRQFFGESDDTVNKKIKAATEADLKPILCIGETEAERDSNKTFSVLDKQVEKGLEGFAADALDKLVIAYEPVWAIGTGKTATPDQVQEVHNYLRGLISKLFGNNLANSMRILYGGSVKPNNVTELMSLEDVDGALVGGASLDPETFSKIVKYKI